MKRSSIRSRNFSLWGVLFLVLVWYGAAIAIGAEIILPTPAAAFTALIALLGRGAFWSSVGFTVLRGFLGFFLSFALGLLMGVASGKNRLIRSFTKPLVVVIRSTPVMSVILLAMIWFKSDSVPVFVSFLMAFPIVLGNVTEGVLRVDAKLMEMARFFRVPKRDIFFGIELPSLFPFLMAGAEAALGLTWKVVIAAEVLSQPIHAIGTRLQDAKVYLETASVFAWTVVAVFLSAVTEVLFRLALRRWRFS